MTNRLKGKVAVVTGAGRGLGRAYAMGLAEEGARVVVNDLGVSIDDTGTSRGPADGVVEEIKRMGGEAVANYDTVSSMPGAENIIRAAVDSFGRLDILVNNAASQPEPVMIWDMTEKVWDAVMAVHLKGLFACTKYAVTQFLKQKGGGCLINISSTAGLARKGTRFGAVPYATAKEGVVGFTRSVAAEVAQYGITCNAIRPHAFSWRTQQPGLVAEMERQKGPDWLKEFQKNQPEDVAPLVVFLATNEAATITGKTFRAFSGDIMIFSEPEERKTIHKDGRWTVEELLKIIPAVLMA